MNYEQARNGMLGLLVGDALGVPYEFTPSIYIPPFEEINYEPPKGFAKAHNVPAGTWSDDGSQALCVLDAILTGKADETLEKAVGDRLLAWRTTGYWAVDGHVFDVGITTNSALNRIMSGVSAEKAGMTGERTKSNGSLMRTLPIAILSSDDEIVRAAMGQSRVTHAELEPMLCCAVYSLWAKYLTVNRLQAVQAWQRAWDALYKNVPKAVLPFVKYIEMWKGEHSGDGYCLDALYSAKDAVDQGTDFESTIRIAIQFGNDTDTTAAIAGGIAGIKYGVPKHLLDGLRSKEMLEPLFALMKDRCTP